jgi:polyprenyl P-hydroxybenzoate/phenylacrylic acid decarboxylase-like protein
MASRHPTGAPPRTRVVVGLSSVDALAYGLRLLEILRDGDVETHVVVSRDASRALGTNAARVKTLAAHTYASENQAARISSGSFLTRGMVVAPCDVSSVAAIVMGLATNLVYRAADVTLKEGRPLVLGVPAEALERIPDEIRERAAGVPGLELLPLAGPPDEAVAALLAQLGVDGASVAA